MAEIASFSGNYRFLSNFYLVDLVYEGVSYRSVEHAYQAAKTFDHLARLRVAAAPTPGEAKKLGRALRLRSDWETAKFDVMLELLRQKFAHEELADLLVATYPMVLVEGNDWGDRIWGVCGGVGENRLGWLLMQVRDELRAAQEEEVPAKDDLEEGEIPEGWWLEEKTDLVWREDSCTRQSEDHEGLMEVHFRLFGVEYNDEEFETDYHYFEGTLAEACLFDNGVVLFDDRCGLSEVRLLKDREVPKGSAICPVHRQAYDRVTGECWQCPVRQLALSFDAPEEVEVVDDFFDVDLAEASSLFDDVEEDFFDVDVSAGSSLFDTVSRGRRAHSIEEVEALGGYSIIYADPNWQYRHAGGRGAAENHFRTSKVEHIADLQVARIAAKNAVLFLWCTWPIYVDAPEDVTAVIRAWGFEPKTLGFLWVKTNKKAGTPFWGGGSWTRANSEFCLLCTRGDVRAVSHAVHQLVETEGEVLREPQNDHSAKPAVVRDRIVELVGDVPRIELYARERAAGWDAWGDQVPGGPDVDLFQK